MAEQSAAVCVCWYKKEQWKRLKEIIPSYETLDDTYEDWKKNAEISLSAFRRNGHKVQKVRVDVEEMLLWANENDFRLNDNTRSLYATYLLEKRNKAKPKKRREESRI